MRYSGSEKLEIIRLVEQSTLSVCRTLASVGIPRSTFYDWYSRYQDGGIEALEDGKPRPRRVWNKIPDEVSTAIVNLALEEPDLSPREVAVNFTDTEGSFVSEASVYRLLRGRGLITSPAFILMKAADRFAKKPIRYCRGPSPCPLRLDCEFLVGGVRCALGIDELIAHFRLRRSR